MSFELKDPLDYTFTRDFFNVHPVLHVVFATNQDNLNKFIAGINSSDYQIKWEKNTDTKFLYEIVSYRASINNSDNRVACLCYPRDMAKIATTKLSTYSAIVKNSKVSGSFTAPVGVTIPNGFTPAYILMKSRKDVLSVLGLKGIVSPENAFLFFDNGVLISDKYSTIMGNPLSLGISDLQRTYELLQIEYSDQVNLNKYANVFQSGTVTYQMHAKLFFNKFIIIRHNGSLGKLGVFEFGKAYKIKGLAPGYADLPFILMREVTKKGEVFKTFMFGRHED
jgi:hypothetical protein